MTLSSFVCYAVLVYMGLGFMLGVFGVWRAKHGDAVGYASGNDQITKQPALFILGATLLGTAVMIASFFDND